MALVTGASRGIGRAIAEGLARAGATVCINYRQQHDRAKETLQSIEASGGHAFVHQADVSDRDQAAALIAAVVERVGRLDILVNNAGIIREGLFLEMSDAEWTSVLGTNLDGVYHCARLSARQMLGRGWGRIINVSSVLVSRAGRGQVNYAASKGGVNALTRALANELAGHGVTVNAIAPGLIETDMSRPFIGVAAKKIREWIPMRRVQDRRIEWRDLRVLAKVIDARYGVAVAPEELRTVAPATIGAILEHLAAKHGIRRADGDEVEVVRALAVRMLADLDGTPLDLSGLTVDRFAGYLRESLHAPAAIEAVMSRFTVRAVGDYIVGQLAAGARLAPGA